MGVDADRKRREELASFLKDRRARADRTTHGLLAPVRAGSGGLRREEVAALAGVSVTWYTWLEQARPINPSPQVLRAIGRIFALRPAELGYLMALGGHPDPPAGRSEPDVVRDRLRHLLESLPYPGFVLAEDWSIIAWNDGYRGLYRHIDEVAEEERNLLWLVFTDPRLRRLMPDWSAQVRRFVSEFRAEVGRLVGSPRITDLVDRLAAESPEFAQLWDERDVEDFTSGQRMFRHPERGLTSYEQHRLVPAEFPDLHVVLYVPSG